jgi:hypothetical protein
MPVVSSRSPNSLLLVLCLIGVATALAAPTFALPQEESSRAPLLVCPPTYVGATNRTVLHRRGVHLLKSARTEAATLEPAMRAVVLSEVAKAYERVDQSQADKLLEETFSASLSIEQGRTLNSGECLASDACQTKQTLQQEVMRIMVSRSVALVEELLPSAEEGARHAIVDSLVSSYTVKKNFDHAEELLTSSAAEEDFPYHAASQLMHDLPPERANDKLTIFVQALANFRQFGGDSLPDSQDLAILVLNFWRELPRPIVLDAIDALVEQAKAAEDSGKMRITFKSKKTNLTFSSAYEYRLFQLMPVLKELDDSHAESLLREDQENRALLRQFPGGYVSLVSETRETSRTADESDGNFSLAYQFGSSSPLGIALQPQGQQAEQVSRRQRQIEEAVTKDPEQAIADALGLPLASNLSPRSKSPRAEALLTIAQMTVGSHPSASGKALEELRKTLTDTPLVQQARLIISLTEIYIQLGDCESARDAVKDGLKIAEKLYRHDSDVPDINQVIKAKWPSANAWRGLVSLAARISPAFASQVLSEIPDPEIATLEKVEVGKTLLGSTSGVTL